MLAITTQWLGFAISMGVAVVAFIWSLVVKIVLWRSPPAPPELRNRARQKQLNREIWMWLAFTLGCGAVLVALVIFDPVSGS